MLFFPSCLCSNFSFPLCSVSYTYISHIYMHIQSIYIQDSRPSVFLVIVIWGQFFLIIWCCWHSKLTFLSSCHIQSHDWEIAALSQGCSLGTERAILSLSGICLSLFYLVDMFTVKNISLKMSHILVICCSCLHCISTLYCKYEVFFVWENIPRVWGELPLEGVLATVYETLAFSLIDCSEYILTCLCVCMCVCVHACVCEKFRGSKHGCHILWEYRCAGSPLGSRLSAGQNSCAAAGWCHANAHQQN